MSSMVMLSNGLSLEPLDGGGGHLIADADGTTLGVVHDDRVGAFARAVGLREGTSPDLPPDPVRDVQALVGYEPDDPTWLAHGIYLSTVRGVRDPMLRDGAHRTLGSVFVERVARFVEVVGPREGAS